MKKNPFKNRQLFAFSITLLIIGFSCNTKEDPVFGQHNAIWTETIFFRGYNPTDSLLLTDQYILNFVKNLKSAHIRYTYIFSGPFQSDGHIPDYAFSATAIRSVNRIKELYPSLVVLPWIGGLQNKTVYLGDSVWRTNAVNDCKRLISVLGVKGVHLDFEYVLPGMTSLDTVAKAGTKKDMDDYPGNVVAFHRQLRDSLPSAYISSVVTSSCPQSNHWKRKTSVKELCDLVPYIDQLNFLFYDTNINDTVTFRQAAEQQFKDIRQIKKVRNVDILLAVATFNNPVEFEHFHNLDVENISNALETIKAAAWKIKSDQRLLDGISIYCNWETGKREWKLLADHYTSMY